MIQEIPRIKTLKVPFTATDSGDILVLMGSKILIYS